MSYQQIPNLTYLGRPVYYSTAVTNQTRTPVATTSTNQSSATGRSNSTSWFPDFIASGGNKRKSYRRKFLSTKKKSRKMRK